MKTPHIVVAHLADGPKATDHASKAAAVRAAKALLATGTQAYVYSTETANRFGLDPRASR